MSTQSPKMYRCMYAEPSCGENDTLQRHNKVQILIVKIFFVTLHDIPTEQHGVLIVAYKIIFFKILLRQKSYQRQTHYTFFMVTFTV